MNRLLEREYVLDPRAVGLNRALFAVGLAGMLGEQRWVADLSAHLYYPPPGLMSLFSGYPSQAQMDMMRWILWGSLALFALGVQTRVAGLLVSTCLILADGFVYSAENVHHHLPLVAAPAFLAFAPASTSFSLGRNAPRNSREDSYSLMLFALFLGALFLSSAAVKLAGGWLNIDTQAAQAHLVTRHVAGINRGILSAKAATWGTPVIWEAFDWLTVGFEALVIVSFPRLQTFRIMIAIAAVFHLVMYIGLSANFADYTLCYMLFVDWWALAAWTRARSRWLRGITITMIVPLFSYTLFTLNHHGLKLALLYFGAGFGALYLAARAAVLVGSPFSLRHNAPTRGLA